MPISEAPHTWKGADVVGSDGEKLGTIADVYVDRQTGEPTFASVKTGLFGMRSSLIPITGTAPHDEHLLVPFTKDQVKSAPNVDEDETLSEDDERRLYEHYGLTYGGGYDGPDHASLGAPGVGPDQVGEVAAAIPPEEQPSVGATSEAGGPGVSGEGLTRSEEELRVSTQRRESGRARLRKYVTTEQVSTSVPVTHEEAHLVREPIIDADPGAEISEAEREVVLHAEEPVVEKVTVPKERVRLETEEVEGEAEVSDSVRREQIETDGPITDNH